MTTLLDGNVLVGLVVTDHVFHDAAENWIAGHDGQVASCAITEGTLLRTLIRGGYSAGQATATLRALVMALEREFWGEGLSHVDIELTGVIGHRQVTDSYLAALARHNGGRLATFDQGLAQLHPDVAQPGGHALT